jgi:hypothetical protein
LSTITIPEKGKDREGKSFDVCGKDGMPKWSSWDNTRRIWAYLGDIAKIIAHGHEGTLYPEELKVGARCDLLAMCKEEESPVKGIERLCKELQPRLDKMSNPADVLIARLNVNALSVNTLDPKDEASDLIDKLYSILSNVDDDDKAAIRLNLNKLVIFFQ